jgi:hypothetical protein
MEGYTNFTKVYATEVNGASIVGPVTGNTAGTHTGPVTGNVTGMAALTAETVAAAGADHTDAAAVTKQVVLVTMANGTKGVIISGDISPRIICNTGEGVLKVYPVLGEPMQGVVNAAVEVAAGKTLVVAKVGTGWYTLFIA